MTGIMIDIALNCLMACLLIATIVYCFKLNKRIRVLQDSKNEFSQLIERFDMTTQRAQSSIQELQTVASKVNEELSGRLDKANFLADDLAFMIEKGNKIADRMDGGMKSSGGSAASAASRGVESSAAAPRAAAGRSSAAQSASTVAPAAAKAGVAERKRAALEAVMQKSATAAKAESAEEILGRKRRPGASARLRSKAEQELYDALKSGNE